MGRIKKEPAELPDGFTSVDDSKPEQKEIGKISSRSGLIAFVDEDGTLYTGYCQEYTTDINAHHLSAKKGDVIFFTVDNNTIPNVTGWKE